MRREQTITSRQRLIVGLLLAFCIDTLRPAVHPAAHQHPGGDRPHVHVGAVSGREPTPSLLAGSGIAPPPATAHGRSSLATASAPGLHLHLLRSLQIAHVAALVPDPHVTCALPLASVDPSGECAAISVTGHARAPPRHTA